MLSSFNIVFISMWKHFGSTFMETLKHFSSVPVNPANSWGVEGEGWCSHDDYTILSWYLLPYSKGILSMPSSFAQYFLIYNFFLNPFMSGRKKSFCLFPKLAPSPCSFYIFNFSLFMTPSNAVKYNKHLKILKNLSHLVI